MADNDASSSRYKNTLRPDPPLTTPSDASVSTIGDLLKEFRELKISLVQSVGQGSANGRNVRGLTCFYCNKEGHKKTDCPDWLATRKQDTYATGVNSIPLVPKQSQNPSNEKMDTSVVSNLVDSIPSVDVYAASQPSRVEVNATKRTQETSGESFRLPPNLRQGLMPSGIPPVVPSQTRASGSTSTGSSHAVSTGPRVTFASPMVEPSKSSVSPTVPTQARKPSRRRPVRRLPISVRKHDVWNKLDRVDAGLSVTEWLMLDPRASLELMDGVRTMRSKRKKYSIGQDGRQVISVESTSRKGKETSPMVVGSVDQWDDGSTDWEDKDSEFSEETFESSITSDEMVLDANLSDESQDDMSCGEYPYSLSELRKSAPLKGPVSVNGIVFECTFDSGAAVSVMSEALALRLGLKFNGDQISLTSFDSLPRKPCNIVPNVPLRVGGHLRSEHMCIQASSHQVQDEYCILGMTWFRNYNASIRAQDNVVVFPISSRMDNVDGLVPDWSVPMVEIQCYSSHDGDGLRSYSSNTTDGDSFHAH
ncbi:hypothetical protein G6F56_010267 [Rhizopus delemar]|uniref:CCHC-type domain-containing protein n=1 Tax=Rhizopus stolonifer TaxID=4846 RepID=A0A367IV72_RHIST|nr:hypothetical protein G6F56_010267 [Rhizopus delemar]RCH81519.1 hypothetical protein CU098_003563 [Rhizopus stolonifer]